MNEHLGLGRLLILAGVGLIALGFLVVVLGRLGLGRLPGDIVVRKPGFTFYFPLASCLILSLILSLLAYLARRR